MGISQFLTVAANTASGNPEPSVGVVVATGSSSYSAFWCCSTCSLRSRALFLHL